MTLDNQNEERVRGAFAALVDVAPLGVEFHELTDVESSVSKKSTSQLGHRRGWLVAAVSAVAVLVLVGGVAWLLRSDGPNTSAASIGTSASLTWSRVPHSQEAFGDSYEQGMNDITVGGAGFVAVGQSGPDKAGEGRAAVWTSADGIAWSRIPHNDAVFDGSVMNSVTAGGPGMVAVGTSDQAAVWTSPDGLVWSRIAANEADFGGVDGRYVSMNSVTAGGPGLVAVGIEGHPHSENVQAVVWTSPDGETWSRVPHNDALFGKAEDGHHTEIQSVAVGGPGLIAVGGAWSRVYDQDVTEGGAAVWTSVDGLSWSRVPHDEATFEGALMNSVTAGGQGLVAVGGESVWTSIDGIDWARIPHDEAVFGGATVDSVTAAGPGLVAVGWSNDPQGGNVVNAAAFTSVDGITWTRVRHDEAVFSTQNPSLPVLEMRGITAIDSYLVAVGSHGVHPTWGATKSDAAVWIADWD